MSSERLVESVLVDLLRRLPVYVVVFFFCACLPVVSARHVSQSASLSVCLLAGIAVGVEVTFTACVSCPVLSRANCCTSVLLSAAARPQFGTDSCQKSTGVEEYTREINRWSVSLGACVPGHEERT